MDRDELRTITVGSVADAFSDAFDEGWRGAAENSVVRPAGQGEQPTNQSERFACVLEASKEAMQNLETVSDLATRTNDVENEYQDVDTAESSKERTLKQGMLYLGAATYHVDQALQSADDAEDDMVRRGVTRFGQCLAQAHRLTDQDVGEFVAYVSTTTASDAVKNVVVSQLREGYA